LAPCPAQLLLHKPGRLILGIRRNRHTQQKRQAPDQTGA